MQARCKPRKPRRLYKRLPEMVAALRSEYKKTALYARHWGTPETKKKAAAPALPKQPKQPKLPKKPKRTR